MKKRTLGSLRNSESFTRFVVDQLASLDVTPKSMFGGCGLYAGEYFFGIIAGDVLYLKVDESNRSAFEHAGMKPFRPYADRGGTMKYYAVPVEVLESGPELERWARAAIKVAKKTRPRRQR